MLGEQSWDAGNNMRVSWGRGTDDTGVWLWGSKNICYAINAKTFDLANETVVYFNDNSLGSNHPGGCQFAIGDGSTTFISQNIDLTVYQSLASRAGNEVVQVP